MQDSFSQLTDRKEEAEGEAAPKNTVKEKWQGAVADGTGFVAVPLALLRLQSKYDLSATDMLVLINLLAHWWTPDSTVYPRNSIIARRMGVDPRTVQRATKKLVDQGLIHRVVGLNGRREFSFDKLARKVAKDLPIAFKLQRGEIPD